MDIEKIKKIDFTKCELPSWRGDAFEVYLDDVVHHYDIYIKHKGVVTVIASSKMVRINSEWVIRFSGAFAIEASFAKHVLKCQNIVDSFIYAETARIEAEENWVSIHWRDADWLQSSGASVEFFSLLDDNWRSEPSGDKKLSTIRYRADRRTFPPGYDPEKPRWVKIHKDDARRLSDAGARVQRKMSWSNDNWMDMTSTERGTPYDYRIDIHTLPPGVPLHEEPKPVPMPGSYSPHHEFTYDLGEIPSLHVLVNGKTFAGHSLTDFSGKRVKIQVDLADDKPAPRPCSKEFALSHPNESECRNSGNGFDSGWRHVSRFSYDAPAEHYDFRTTAKAEKHPLVLLELPIINVSLVGRMPAPETVELGEANFSNGYDPCIGSICYALECDIPDGKWKITATRVG